MLFFGYAPWVRIVVLRTKDTEGRSAGCGEFSRGRPWVARLVTMASSGTRRAVAWWPSTLYPEGLIPPV